LDIVRAGLHCSLRMSRQMLPLLLMLGWKTFVRKETYPEHNQIRKKKDIYIQKELLNHNTSNAHQIEEKKKDTTRKAERVKVSNPNTSKAHEKD
jgi:hypothetical protein